MNDIISSNTNYPEVIIICALEVELHAIKEVFKSKGNTIHSENNLKISSEVLEHVSNPVLYKTNLGTLILVALILNPCSGNVISGLTAQYLIHRYNPWMIVSFGICGSIETEIKEG